MHKTIQYSFIFLMLVILVSAATGDAFDQTVIQIKTLEAELEQNQIDIEEKQTFIEETLTTEFADHALKAPKGEFESDADYQERQRQLAGIIAERRTELEEEHLSPLRVRRLEIQTEIGRLHKKVFFTNDVKATLGIYDANAQRFPIEFEVYDQSVTPRLYVDKIDAPDLKKNWDQVVKTAYISIDPGYRRALVSVKVEYPSLWEHGVTWQYNTVYNLGNNNSIAFSPNGKYFATASDDEYGIANIWKMENGRKFRKMNHGDRINAVAFSPDGKYFATAGQGDIGFTDFGKVIIWEMLNGTQIRERFHGNYVYAVTFSPNSKYVATVTSKNWYNTAETHLWRVHGGQLIWTRSRTINGKVLQTPLAFSPDGTYLTAVWGSTFSSSVDGVTILRVSNGTNARHLENNRVYAAAFSPNGKYLATGNNGSITFYEMSSGKSIKEIEIPNTTAYRVTFSPDGKFLAVLAVRTSNERTSNERNYCYIYIFRVGTEDISFETVIPRVKSRFVGNKVRGLAWHPSGNFISDGERVYRMLLEPILTDMVTKPLETRRDVNRDGVVDVDDLVLVASNFGKSFEADANPNPDVNLDGIVDRADIIEIIISLESAPGAPSVNSPTTPTLTIENLQRWIESAKQHNDKGETYQKGIKVLEQLLAALMQIEIIPEETTLLPNYPNPFNPETWIPYQLAKPADVTLRIYAVDGKLVRTLALGYQAVGKYYHRSRAAYWDGRNAQGEFVASGVYFYTLTAGDFSATRKMSITK